MSDSITVTASQTKELMAVILMKKQQALDSQITMALIDGAASASGSDFQDPSEITPEQLQSPVDIRV